MLQRVWVWLDVYILTVVYCVHLVLVITALSELAPALPLAKTLQFSQIRLRPYFGWISCFCRFIEFSICVTCCYESNISNQHCMFVFLEVCDMTTVAMLMTSNTVAVAVPVVLVCVIFITAATVLLFVFR